MFIFGNINQRSQAKDNLKSQIKNQIRIEKLKQISIDPFGEWKKQLNTLKKYKSNNYLFIFQPLFFFFFLAFLVLKCGLVNSPYPGIGN